MYMKGLQKVQENVFIKKGMDFNLFLHQNRLISQILLFHKLSEVPLY